MAEAFVSMYSDSSSDAEFNDDDDIDDLTSVIQLTLSPSTSNYSYTPTPPNRCDRSRTYPSPSRYSLTRQKLVYSPTKSTCTTSEDSKFHQNCKDDSVLYATAVEESFALDRSSSVVGGANNVVGKDSKSVRVHVANPSLNGTYTVGQPSNHSKKQEKLVDPLCDDFYTITKSTRQTRSAACPAPSSSTCQSRQTGSSSHVCVSSAHQTGQISSTPSQLDCSFAADIQVQIPEKLKSLTEGELRERLVALGERPGPITPSTKVAYLAYLAKLEAGVQPAGNKGYKGKWRKRERERE